MKITLLRTLITACFLCVMGASVSAQGISITGTVEANNLTISGAAYARSLTTSGAVEAGSVTTTGNIGVLGSLYVQGPIFGNINITSLTTLTALSTTTTGSAIIGSGGLTVTGGWINTTGTVYSSALSTSGVTIANGISTTGTIYAGALSTLGVIINSGITTTGSVYASALSTNGVIIGNGITTSGTLYAGGIEVVGSIYSAGLTASGIVTSTNFSTTVDGGAEIGSGGIYIGGGGLTTTGTVFARAISTSGVVMNNGLTVLGSALVTGSVTAASFSGTFLSSTNDALTAAGSTQGAALLLPSSYNVVTTVTAAANGVRLNVPKAGETVTVVNKGTSTLLIYPATGGTIDALGTNGAIGLPADGSIILGAISTTQWYTNSNKANGNFALSVTGAAVASNSSVTTENDMMTYTLPANTLRTNNQTIRIKVFGYTTAANNAKTFRVYFGGTLVYTGAITANSVNFWLAEVLIVRTGVSTQSYAGIGWFNQTLLAQTQGTLAISETADIIIKTTGQVANTGQFLTQRAMIIELINDR